MGLLDDRVAVTTGAAQGIGHTIAERFIAEGASVAGVALFRASDPSSYTTGTVLEVTGGRFM